jgi:hypothetical protein
MSNFWNFISFVFFIFLNTSSLVYLGILGFFYFWRNDIVRNAVDIVGANLLLSLVILVALIDITILMAYNLIRVWENIGQHVGNGYVANLHRRVSIILITTIVYALLFIAAIIK